MNWEVKEVERKVGTIRDIRGDAGRGRGGHRWQSVAVCPGTATGQSSTPALRPVPVDRQADCHLSHSNTHLPFMHTFEILHPTVLLGLLFFVFLPLISISFFFAVKSHLQYTH